MTSFLLSALARKYRGATLDAFRAVHGHGWLVWEPGVWKPPTKDGGTLTAMRMPTPAPTAGEALALALQPRVPGAGQVTVGRASTSDIEINDATLSQTHLLLMEAKPGEWTVRDAGSKNGSWVDGIQLQAGAPLPLSDGARIQAAQVVLTFYAPDGLFKRLQAWAPAITPLPLGTLK